MENWKRNFSKAKTNSNTKSTVQDFSTLSPIWSGLTLHPILMAKTKFMTKFQTQKSMS